MSSVPALAAISPPTTSPSSAPSRRGAPSRAERRLARALRARTPEALERVHAEFGAAVLGFLVRALGDRGAAEDVFQIVFTEVWQRAGEYDPARAGLLTWILTIARSRAIDHRRRRIPEPRDPGAAPAARDRLAEDELDGLLADARLAWLLRRLPGEEADVLRLRFREDRTQAEIAATLDVPLGTVKMRMVHGLDRLRLLLEDEGADA